VASLTFSADLIGVVDTNGDVMDVVPFRMASTTSDFNSAIVMLRDAQLDALWLPATCGGGPCDTGAEYDAIAVDWSGTATTSTGVSMRRTWGVDTNGAADWNLGTSSWGAVNP
jgi:hypothetical protein